MLALSVVFAYNWPFCFRGAEPFESIFEFFRREYSFLVAKVFVCGSVSALGLVFESLWSIGFVMPNISSMYLLWAYLSILLARCLDSRWACLSAGRLYCLYLLNKWSRLRMGFIMSCVIHDSDDLVLIVRWEIYTAQYHYVGPSWNPPRVSWQFYLHNWTKRTSEMPTCVSKPSQSAFL